MYKKNLQYFLGAGYPYNEFEYYTICVISRDSVGQVMIEETIHAPTEIMWLDSISYLSKKYHISEENKKFFQ